MEPDYAMAWSKDHFSTTTSTIVGTLRRARGKTVVAILLFTFVILAFSSFSSSSTFGDVSQSAKSTFNILDVKMNLGDIQNNTLGFQKIYGMNLPERTDRRDAILLQGKLTNITIDFVDAVVGSEVSPKALPYTLDLSKGAIGCWRAHLNIYAKMIEQNIQTALVIEDDADWDIGLKSQLVEFARGSRWLLDSDDKANHSPYGDNWDILWLGHCQSEATSHDNRRWVIPQDPTVPPKKYRSNFEQPDMSPWEQGDNADAQTRIVHVQKYGYCTAGYAISLRGAERMLYAASMIPHNFPIDMHMGNMCSREIFPDFTCIAPFPRLIGVSYAAGSNAKDTDIEHENNEKPKVYKEDRSENLMFSVRHNIRRILKKETIFHSFFPNPSGDLLPLQEITRARGHPEHIRSASE